MLPPTQSGQTYTQTTWQQRVIKHKGRDYDFEAKRERSRINLRWLLRFKTRQANLKHLDFRRQFASALMAGDDACQSCGHAGAEFCCSRCRARFCNPGCYRDAWPKHKALCRPAGKPSDGGDAGESADIQEILEGKIFVT